MYPGTWAASTPDKPALIIAETGQTTTYAELDDRSLRLAHVFADAGLVTGDVVALISDNAPQAYEVYWAALRSGLYVTAVNHHLSADEAAYIVNDCGAKAMVVSGRQDRAGRGDGREDRRPGAAGLRWRRPGLHVVRRGAVDGEHRAAGRPAARRRLPLLLGHHRAAQGDQAPAAADPGRRAGLSLRDDLRRPVRLRPGHRLPLAGAGLPRGAAALHRRDPGARRHGRADAALRAGGVPARGAGVRRHRHPVRADDVRADAQAARGGAGVVRHLQPEDRRARGGAVPGRGEAADDGVARADRARVLRQHRGQRRHLRRAGGLAGASRRRSGVRCSARRGSATPTGCGAAGGPGRDDLLRARRRAVHLPRRPREDRLHPAPGAPVLVDGGRPRLRRRGGLPVPHRPQGVHDHQRRGEHLSAGDRGPVQPAPLGARHRRDRCARRGHGRARGGLRRARAARPAGDLAAELTAYARERIAHFKVPSEFIVTDDLPRTPTGKLVKGKLRERYAGASA